MRYLKSINEHNKDYFNDLINWEMIADAKELSLDYLDQGMLFSIYVLNGGRQVYREHYSHDPNEVEKVWVDNDYKLDIQYKFFLSEHVKGDYIRPTPISHEARNMLVDELKKMYPDEKIYYF